MMDTEKLPFPASQPVRKRKSSWLKITLAAPALLVVALFTHPTIFDQLSALKKGSDCLDPVEGYICRTDISRYWGQYSPYFKVPSEIPAETPEDCEITFAQVLSRHGARDPTLKRTLRLVQTVTKIKALATLEGKYAFIKKYNYNLGADKLNELGRRELRQSGKQAHDRYAHLGDPFVRAASQQRVIDSALAFVEGYGSALNMTIIYEGPGLNNTLAHWICPSIEEGPISKIREDARDAWENTFLPTIAARLTADLKMEISQDDAHNLMSMCPMSTVHDPKGRPTPFCDLFSVEEFKEYNHLEALEKFYGWGKGNPLGPTQGVGFAAEVIARMLDKPVENWTSVNHTLDDHSTTFPLGKQFYADFSHDDDLTSAFFALGLYSNTPTLSITEISSTDDLYGWTPSQTVPFGGRGYFEKMKCKGHSEELVRAIVNDRVIPLDKCDPDELGRCKLGKYIESLEFVRQGGKWPLCFLGLEDSKSMMETTLEGVLLNGSASLEL